MHKLNDIVSVYKYQCVLCKQFGTMNVVMKYGYSKPKAVRDHDQRLDHPTKGGDFKSGFYLN